jgi:hypothetical protein
MTTGEVKITGIQTMIQRCYFSDGNAIFLDEN